MRQYNYFIVQSPLQVLNSYEAINKFNLFKDVNILILIKSGHNETEKQMKYLLKQFGVFNTIIEINLPKNKFENIKFIFEANKKLRNFFYYKNKKVFIGDFRNYQMLHIANSLKAEDYFLVDDGVATILYDDFMRKVRSKITILKHKCFMYNIKKIDFKFFTIFNVENSIKNNYDFLKNMFNLNNKRYIKNNTVFFIGQPLVSVNIIEKEYFNYLLSYVRKLHKNYEFVYIMHRLENEDYIKSLSTELNMTYIKNNNLIELELIKQKYLPKKIITFYSSAIFTLKVLFNNYKEIEFEAIKINKNNIIYNNLKKLDFEKVYKEMKDFNINVKEVKWE